MKPLSIAHLASEMAPLAKVGGLGDVVAALAGESAECPNGGGRGA